MAEYLLGLDSGTTGVRAKIYDTTGAVIASASQEYECEYPRPGWVEQDVHVLSEANLDVLRRVVTDSGVDTAHLRSLGLSTQRGLHLYVDETGKVLRNGRGLSWQDARHGCQLDQLREQVGEERFHEITGLPIAAFWPVGKILWVAQNEPGVLARTARIISTQELFLRQLSDVEEYHVDRSNASLFGLMDVDRLEWSPELLDFLGLSENLLPTIVPSAHQVGHVTSDVARRTGLPVGLPVSTGGGDQQCAGIGAGVISPGLCELTIGTAGNSVAYLAETPRATGQTLSRTVHATPDPSWVLEGIQASGGAAYRWLRDTLGKPYIELDRLAAKSPPGAHGLLFHPYLAGSMTPHYDEHARAGFVGLTLRHSLGDLARAVLEGVAFEVRENFAAHDDLGIDLDEIRFTGGAARSELWCQIQADVYGKPVTVMREGECSVLGAAILGAVGAGVFPGVREGASAMAHTKTTFEPDPVAHRRYTTLWQIYRDTYRALAERRIYHALSTLQQD